MKHLVRAGAHARASARMARTRPKRVDLTFSTCDIVRFWYNNMTFEEQNEVLAFFSIVVPAMDRTFDMLTFFSGLLQRPSLTFGPIVDALGKIRLNRDIRKLEELQKVFTTPGTAQCVHDWLWSVIRHRNIA